jgi:hypothetical protein
VAVNYGEVAGPLLYGHQVVPGGSGAQRDGRLAFEAGSGIRQFGLEVVQQPALAITNAVGLVHDIAVSVALVRGPCNRERDSHDEHRHPGDQERGPVHASH